jgi:hypothetical protein
MKKRKNVKLSLKKTKVSELNESFQEGLKGGNGSYQSAVNGSCNCGGGGGGNNNYTKWGFVCNSLNCSILQC